MRSGVFQALLSLLLWFVFSLQRSHNIFFLFIIFPTSGHMRGSLLTLQRLVQLFPSDTTLKNDLGVGYLLMGDNDSAKKVYEEVSTGLLWAILIILYSKFKC